MHLKKNEEKRGEKRRFSEKKKLEPVAQFSLAEVAPF
jgi:hypothetical protein